MRDVKALERQLTQASGQVTELEQALTRTESIEDSMLRQAAEKSLASQLTQAAATVKTLQKDIYLGQVEEIVKPVEDAARKAYKAARELLPDFPGFRVTAVDGQAQTSIVLPRKPRNG